jgi:hypothetical protein
VAAWYPNADAYFVPAIKPERPILQGDIFRGVPTAYVDHPVARERAFAAADPPTPEQAEGPLSATAVREATAIKGGYTMILPHPCDFAETEKGASHSTRLVARLERIASTRVARKHVVRGAVHHTAWVPDWATLAPEDDYFLDLRTTSAVDRSYLNRDRRVAALTGPAWIALMRRLAFFYTRTLIDDRALALEQAHQHPDYAKA